VEEEAKFVCIAKKKKKERKKKEKKIMIRIEDTFG